MKQKKKENKKNLILKPCEQYHIAIVRCYLELEAEHLQPWKKGETRFRVKQQSKMFFLFRSKFQYELPITELLNFIYLFIFLIIALPI